MKKNILVLPCGSEIGLELFRSLAHSTHFKLFGGSSVDDHGLFVYKNYISNLPFVDDNNFIQAVNHIVKKHQIDFIIPATDSAVLSLARANSSGNLMCEVIAPRVETCELARSKIKTYTRLRGVVSTPKVYVDAADLVDADFPVFLKPDVGQGSKGTYLAKSVEDVEFYHKKDPSLLILEFLPGKEYTIDCFTNKAGELLFSSARERKRILNGISANSTAVKDDQFIEMAQKINQAIQFRGGWFFQVKENHSSDLVLLEIAARIAGTSGVTRAQGVNLPLLTLFDAMDFDVQAFPNDYTVTIDRALENKYSHNLFYKHVYLDFDDLVIFENKVNPAIMAFVYQCLNKGVKVHLITKHAADLPTTLKQYRLDSLFDEVIWIQNGSEKSEYIKSKDAIFIDDSFAERKQIHTKLGIPVFDSHMLESLMEEF